MNWRRGFFRLWIIATLIWWGLLGYLWHDACVTRPQSTDCAGPGLIALATIFILIPIGVLVAGFAINWVIVGFRRG